MSTTDAPTREADSLALVEVPEGADAYEVFAAENTDLADRILAMVEARIKEFKQLGVDASTEDGRDLIARFARRITKSRTTIEAAGKAVADEVKLVPGRVDANRRHIKKTLEKWHDDVRQPLTDWEAAEKARTDKIKASLEELKAVIADPEWPQRSSEQLRDRLGEIERDFGVISEEVFAEYAGAARELATNAIGSLETRIATVEKQEAEAAELERLRAAQAEQEKRDRERKIAEEAAAQAKADAEAKVIAETERANLAEAARKQAVADAERNATEAAAKAKADAEQAAKARAEQEAAEAKAREEDRAHRASVHRAALNALIKGGVAEDVAKQVIIMIASRLVPHVRIEY